MNIDLLKRLISISNSFLNDRIIKLNNVLVVYNHFKTIINIYIIDDSTIYELNDIPFLVLSLLFLFYRK